MKTEKFIANGHVFNTYEEVEKYAEALGLRITNTETINTSKGRRYIIYLNK